LIVRLQAPTALVGALRSFYVHRIGFEPVTSEGQGDPVRARIGRTTLEFSRAPTDTFPFYHFALLIPGDRFEAAHAWLRSLVELLPDPDSGDTVFDFDNWGALACYFIDPAGNIVEAIAHTGMAENGAVGAFSPNEFVGFSELGLVVRDKSEAATLLAKEADLHVWDGELEQPERLAFVGEPARTLILSPPGRPWLPTNRYAEPFPLQVVVTGIREYSVDLLNSGQVIEVCLG
jgi:catechol 2,3-dioxygenase-like lactoylglutathione lyase family enzyme